MARKEDPQMFPLHLEESDLKRERALARDLRESQWWKRRLAKGACHDRGRAFPPRELTMDHIVPISREAGPQKATSSPAARSATTPKTACAMEWENYLKQRKHP